VQPKYSSPVTVETRAAVGDPQLGMVGHFRPIVLAEEIVVLSVLLSWKTSYDRANPQSRLSWVLVLNVRRHISATTRILRQLTALPVAGITQHNQPTRD
jgi:hypothetical protein